MSAFKPDMAPSAPSSNKGESGNIENKKEKKYGPSAEYLRERYEKSFFMRAGYSTDEKLQGLQTWVTGKMIKMNEDFWSNIEMKNERRIQRQGLFFDPETHRATNLLTLGLEKIEAPAKRAWRHTQLEFGKIVNNSLTMGEQVSLFISSIVDGFREGSRKAKERGVDQKLTNTARSIEALEMDRVESSKALPNIESKIIYLNDYKKELEKRRASAMNLQQLVAKQVA